MHYRKADTANVAISAMKQAGVRHLVVADKIKDGKLTGDSTVIGLISMQDVMSVVQKDERLSLQSLARKYPGIANPLDQMREQLKSDANARARDNPETTKADIIRVGTAVLGLSSVALFFSESQWIHDHADLVMIGIFVLGYVGIIFEEVFEFDKAAVALLMVCMVLFCFACYRLVCHVDDFDIIYVVI